MSDHAIAELNQRVSELSSLIEANPIYLPVTEVAAFLHVKPDGLRASMEQGRCPFGFCWKLGEKIAYKIPTLAFFAWLMGTNTVSKAIA